MRRTWSTDGLPVMDGVEVREGEEGEERDLKRERRRPG